MQSELYIYIYRSRSNNFRLLISDKDNAGRTAVPLLFPLSLPRIIRPRIIVTVIEACYLSGKLAAIIYRCWRISFQRREPSLRFHFPHTFRIIVLLNLARLRFLLRLLIVRSCFSSLIRFNKISKVNCRMKMARMSNARSIELLFFSSLFSLFLTNEEKSYLLWRQGRSSLWTRSRGYKACRKDVWFRREDFYVSWP